MTYRWRWQGTFVLKVIGDQDIVNEMYDAISCDVVAGDDFCFVVDINNILPEKRK